MEHIETNAGDFSILTKLSGSKVSDVDAPKKAEPEKDPEWQDKLQKQWLSVHNDFLFTKI